MKCFKLSFVFLVVAQLSVALFVPESNGLVARQNNRLGGNRNGQNGGNNNQNGGNNNQNGGNNNQNGGNNNQNGGNNNQNPANNTQNGGNNNGGNGGNADPQTSLTLDPTVIQTVNGKGQAAGEADSLVSTNNFIGFCVGKTITNGKQVQAGSCNPTPMGDIPSVDNMPSVKFEFPPNGGNVAADTQFTIVMNTRGMQTGTFTNAANTYYAAPQQLNNAGQIIGHNHVVVEEIPALDSTQPTNPRVFAFFKGLNAAAANGKLTADLPKGLPAGTYRLSSISSAGNHQSVVMPVAQRGAVDDAVYFTVGGNGNNGQNGGNNGQNPVNNGQNGGNQNGGNQNGGNQNGGNQNGGNQNRGNGGRNGGRNGRRYERRFFTWH
jgi:hypothetical protein